MGLEQLTAKILAEAREKSAQMAAQARRRVEEIQTQTASQVAKMEAAAKEELEHEAGVLRERARSLARLERRKLILAAKWRVIERVLAAAADMIRGDDYGMLLHELVRKHRQEGWTVHLSEQDTREYGEEIGADEPAPISGGAVFRSGNLEINLSLEAVLAQIREELAGELARILFPEESQAR